MNRAIKLGVLRLVDSAPAVVAEARGFFAAESLDVTLSVEPSWANIADKLAWGALDAAICLTPLALAVAAGLRAPQVKLRVPMGISRGGNAIVASGVDSARDFMDWLRSRSVPPRFAVVHVFSTHNLLLRHWLRQGGLDPDAALDLVMVPPERVVDEMTAGRIAGFCAGAPWGELAQELGVGRIVAGSSSIRPGHAEKSLAVADGWAAGEPQLTEGLVRALRRAQDECEAMCRVPERASALAALLAMRLRLPAEATRNSLPRGSGSETVSFASADRIDAEELAWVASEMRRWGWIASDVEALAMLAL